MRGLDALDVRDQLGDVAPDLLGGREAVDLGEVVVDAHEPQLAVVDREPDRRAGEDGVEHPVGLVGLGQQPGAVGGGGAALGELGGERAVLGAERAAGGQRQRAELLAAREQRRDERRRAPAGSGSSSAIVQRSATAAAAASTARSRVSSVARAGERLARGGQHARARGGRLAAGADERAADGERAERADREHEEDPVGRLHVVREQARDDGREQGQHADPGGAAPVGAERGDQRRDPVERDHHDVRAPSRGRRRTARSSTAIAATTQGRERVAPMAFSTTSCGAGGRF